MRYLFYSTGESELPALRAHGARDAILWKTLRSARRAGSGPILVVDADVAKGLVQSPSMSTWAARVPPAALLNASPYRAPRVVIAGGGIVMRARGRDILLIRRRGIWDLPKGKRERGEAVQDCALREVAEETGVTDLKLKGLLGQTMHGYAQSGRFYIKETFWYLMQSDATAFRPAHVEGIDDVAWTPWEQAAPVIGHATLQEFLGLVASRVEAGFARHRRQGKPHRMRTRTS